MLIEVDLPEEDVASLRRLSADARIVPFGDAKPRGGSSSPPAVSTP